MPIRIDPPVTQIKSIEMTADRAKDLKAQSLNPAMLEQRENVERDRLMNRTNVRDNVENVTVHPDDKNNAGNEDDEKKENAEQAAEQSRIEQLKQKASRDILSLPVDKGKYAKREELVVDIIL